MTNPALAKKLRAEATGIRTAAEAAYEAAIEQAAQLEASADVLAGETAPAPRGKRGVGRPPKAERKVRRVSNAPRPTSPKEKSGRYADPETKARALKLLAEGKTVAQVAEAVGKTASAIYLWRSAARKARS